jgi:pimeloyl-ACP methyl ester carboxylesterase
MVDAVVADMWAELMSRLGYVRFGAQGSDIGADVTSQLGLRHADQVAGVHLSAVTFPTPPEPWTDAEAAFLDSARGYSAEEGAYSALQATKPQTLGAGLNDSPAGLAAWVVEKFRTWSDSGGDVETRFSRDRLLTNLTIYWVTETITSSTRMYWDYRHHVGDPTPKVPVPSAFANFDNGYRSPGRAPRELAERYFNVTQWTDYPRGGHFPASEEPELLASDIREFFRPLR